jgi:hypothetical protein
MNIKYGGGLPTGSSKVFLSMSLLLISFQFVFSQQLPIGYISYYSEKGTTPGFLKTLVISPNEGFVINKERTFIELNPSPIDSGRILMIPYCRGIISDKIFGEYIIEFEYKIQTGSLNYSSGFYFLSPVKSNDTYYTTIFSNDTIAFVYINDGLLIRKETKSSEMFKTGWNKVRIQRDMLNRKLEVTLNNNINNKITFTDRDLIMGYIGFGTQDISSYLRNINIWAPTAFSDTLYHGE